jgi:outer membrane protein assembly factor BamB
MTKYPWMAEPPSLAGAFQDTTAEPSPGIAVTPVGAPGAVVRGVVTGGVVVVSASGGVVVVSASDGVVVVSVSDGVVVVSVSDGVVVVTGGVVYVTV